MVGLKGAYRKLPQHQLLLLLNLLCCQLLIHNGERKSRRNQKKALYNLSQTAGPNQSDGLCSVTVSDRQQQAGQTADMIAVIVGKQNIVNRFKAPAELSERNLRALAAVDQKACSFIAHDTRSQPAPRQRHHAAGPQQTNIKHLLYLSLFSFPLPLPPLSALLRSAAEL